MVIFSELYEQPNPTLPNFSELWNIIWILVRFIMFYSSLKLGRWFLVSFMYVPFTNFFGSHCTQPTLYLSITFWITLYFRFLVNPCFSESFVRQKNIYCGRKWNWLEMLNTCYKSLFYEYQSVACHFYDPFTLFMTSTVCCSAFFC